MANEWDAEHIVTPDDALVAIGQQFPELNPTNIKLFGAGWDNTAYLVNDTYVFRFPRRSMAVPLLQHEAYILPKIAPFLPLAVPMPEWFGKPFANYPWSFMGYRLLPGKTTCELDLSDEERTGLAEPLAEFLSALHRLPVLEEYKQKLPTDALRKLDVTFRVPKLKEHLKEIESLGLLHYTDPFYALADAVTGLQITPKIMSLVHGDLYVRHLLVDEHHHLTGIIDWGDVHIGDPAVDLAITHSFLPPSAHEVFRKAYGQISEETWQLARFRALCHNAVLVLYGHKSGPSIAREALRALEYIAG